MTFNYNYILAMTLERTMNYSTGVRHTPKDRPTYTGYKYSVVQGVTELVEYPQSKLKYYTIPLH